MSPRRQLIRLLPFLLPFLLLFSQQALAWHEIGHHSGLAGSSQSQPEHPGAQPACQDCLSLASVGTAASPDPIRFEPLTLGFDLTPARASGTEPIFCGQSRNRDPPLPA